MKHCHRVESWSHANAASLLDPEICPRCVLGDVVDPGAHGPLRRGAARGSLRVSC